MSLSCLSYRGAGDDAIIGSKRLGQSWLHFRLAALSITSSKVSVRPLHECRYTSAACLTCLHSPSICRLQQIASGSRIPSKKERAPGGRGDQLVRALHFVNKTLETGRLGTFSLPVPAGGTQIPSPACISLHQKS